MNMYLPPLLIPVTLAGNPCAVDKEERPAPEPDKEVMARIHPIGFTYQPGYYWGSFIYLPGGQVICTRLTAEELDQKIKAYWDGLANAQKARGKIFAGL